MKVDVHPEFGHVASVELDMDIEYKGGFKLATDADLVLGKCAALCVKGEQNFQLTLPLGPQMENEK